MSGSCLARPSQLSSPRVLTSRLLLLSTRHLEAGFHVLDTTPSPVTCLRYERAMGIRMCGREAAIAGCFPSVSCAGHTNCSLQAASSAAELGYITLALAAGAYREWFFPARKSEASSFCTGCTLDGVDDGASVEKKKKISECRGYRIVAFHKPHAGHRHCRSFPGFIRGAANGHHSRWPVRCLLPIASHIAPRSEALSFRTGCILGGVNDLASAGMEKISN